MAIEDEEVPLASAVPEAEETGLSGGMILGICAGAVAILVLVAAVILNKKKKNV